MILLILCVNHISLPYALCHDKLNNTTTYFPLLFESFSDSSDIDTFTENILNVFISITDRSLNTF